MSEIETLLAITAAAFFGIIIILILVYMIRAYLDDGAKRWEQQAMNMVRRGLCPCGAPMPPAPATNCPSCGNWIKGFRDAAESAASDIATQKSERSRNS